MQMGMKLNCKTFAVVFKACSYLEYYGLGIQLHGLSLSMGFVYDVVTGSALVDMHAKNKNLEDSCHVFHEIPVRNWISWSAVTAGYVQNDQLLDSFELFKEIQQEGVEVSQSIYAIIFRSCAGFSSLRFGSQMYGHALKNNFASNVIVETFVLDIYQKFGYAQNQLGFEAVKMFRPLIRSSVDLDGISLSGTLSACAVIQGHLEGLEVHALTIKSGFDSNICVANAFLDMYGKSYEHNGYGEEILELFCLMLRSGMEPDEFSSGSVIKACAGSGKYIVNENGRYYTLEEF
ncbi:hypothetical protein GIB67_024239 [Kingdonia uniflora]|uniref:Pentatricopeptide repeat-containing protein n=1 Tax=Kingdonia uniflora TaxID=39325 RepID=A0A7J7LZT8_9MAGN|nr:hypothetical protein GIB67_024239 [Kingdonia uniflora]